MALNKFQLIYRNEIYRAEMILPSEYENLEVISFCSIDEELVNFTSNLFNLTR